MNSLAPHPHDAFSETRARHLTWLLCLLAAVHVFIFSATFPFFNVVDEQEHLDLVVRYSHLEIPRAIDTPCDEALQFISVFGTIEYLWPPSSQPGGRIAPPPWTRPLNVIRQNLLDTEAIWKEKVKNHEASQPPLYYSLAALWWWLGKIIGLDGGQLLYWLRFLNIPLIMLLVWLGGFAARKIFPENYFIRVAVPSFIAFMPQTTFYAINNDILSPITFGVVCLLLLKFWNAENLLPRLAVALGLALASAFLTKISNLPLLAVAGFFLALKIFSLAQSKNLRSSISSLAILFACAGLPMAVWMTWCKINFGDFTGSAPKIQFLGWTHKPFVEWFHHPVFTASGFWYFVKGNLSTFWQGELLWQRKPLAIPAADLIYVALSLGLLAPAFFRLLRPPTLPAPQRAALWFGLACLVSAFGFFVLLSVKYDFQDCFYPSRKHPFFVSGRLLLGMLIPFLLLFTFGLDSAMRKFTTATKFAVLVAILLFMLVTEITVDWPIFPNAYNWFHM